MTTFKVFDNRGEDYGEYETREAARDAVIDLMQMDLEDDGYFRRQYEIKSIKKEVQDYEKRSIS